MRLVISPSGTWTGLCMACHKLLKSSLFPEKAVLSCPTCKCCITVKMDVILDRMIEAKRTKEKIVLSFTAIG